MRSVLAVFVVLTIGFINGYERDSYGELRVSSGGCRLKYPLPCFFVSHEYPKHAPHQLKQTARYAIDKKPDERVAVRMSCEDFSLPQNEDGSCDTDQLIVEDLTTRKSQIFCGNKPGLISLTESVDVYFIFTTGPRGGGRFNCTINSVYLSSSGEEEPITEAPYLTHEFEEEDSSEHGGEPGEIGTTCPCGTANKISSRIVNGTVTLPNEYPFIAAIVEKKGLSQFCGGAIISDRHVLTAAHCTLLLHKYGASNYAVIAGAHDLNKRVDTGHRQVIGIKNFIQHEKYYLQENHHDISMVILEKPLKFNPFVTRVCLPKADMDFVHKPLKVIGWGSQYLGGRGSNLLRQVNIRGYSVKECSFAYNNLISEQLCTYRTSKSSCKGDSGGPVVWVDPDTNRYTLAGLVSFGRVCGDTSPTIHSKVSAYLDWIMKIIEGNNPAEVCSKL